MKKILKLSKTLQKKFPNIDSLQIAYSTLKEVFRSDFKLPELKEAKEREERRW